MTLGTAQIKGRGRGRGRAEGRLGQHGQLPRGPVQGGEHWAERGVRGLGEAGPQVRMQSGVQRRRGQRAGGRGHWASQLRGLGLQQGQGRAGARGRDWGGAGRGSSVPHVGRVSPQVRHQLLTRVESPAAVVSALHPGAHELRGPAHCQREAGGGRGGGRGRWPTVRGRGEEVRGQEARQRRGGAGE